MVANLSRQRVADTFKQLLHVDGGVDGELKPVFGAGGVETSMHISTDDARFKQLTIDKPLDIEHGGTGAKDVEDIRNNLGLGTLAMQNADSVRITGGYIDPSLMPGLANPFTRHYGGFSARFDQLRAPSSPGAPVMFDVPLEASGVSIVDGTKISVADDGVYLVEATLLFRNTSAVSQQAYAWFETQNGPASGSLVATTVAPLHTMQLRFFTLRSLSMTDWFSLMWSATTDAISLVTLAPDGIPAIAAAAQATVMRVG